MKHGTLTTKGNRVELRFERRLTHPPEKVWRALTDSKELAHWFPARIEGAREAGAELRFFFEQGDPGTGKISVFDPPRVLEYTWEGDLLRWELKPEGTGCLLVFTTVPADRANVARDATGWHFCLDNLEAAVDGNPAAGFDKERFSALTRLDHNRAISQLAAKLNVPVTDIKKMTIWGNHSATQYPDLFHAEIGGRNAAEAVGDQDWLENTFIPTVAKRGAAIIAARGLSSAASAASAMKLRCSASSKSDFDSTAIG